MDLALALAIETHALRRVFGDLVAVDGIDLAVPKGSLCGFLGPNGAGKSTTIKRLTGLLAPSSGTMRILGIDPLADPVAVKLKVGGVPEDLALFERLSGAATRGKLIAQGTLEELRAGATGGRTLEEIFLGLVGAGEHKAPALEWLRS